MQLITNTHLEAVDQNTANSLNEDQDTMLFNYRMTLCTLGYYKDIKTWAIIDLAAFYVTHQMESFNNLYALILAGQRTMFGPLREFHMAFYEYYLLENKSLFIYLYKWFTWTFNAYGSNRQKIETEFWKLTKKPKTKPAKNNICDLIVICTDP